MCEGVERLLFDESIVIGLNNHVQIGCDRLKHPLLL